jgi:uncharacterized protein with HEPN domain
MAEERRATSVDEWHTKYSIICMIKDLRLIKENLPTIDEFVDDKNKIRSMGLIKAMENVGERSKQVSMELQDRYANIPWGDMRRISDTSVMACHSTKMDHSYLEVKEVLSILPSLEKMYESEFMCENKKLDLFDK